MKPSEVTYQFIEDAERLDYYVPGGYHPVNIGDKFCAGRYTVIHKLGFGRSATTWIAEDKQQKHRLVALKIFTAESAYRTQEEQILSRLARAESQLPGKEHIQAVHDSFVFTGPNGTHRCLVMDVERVSIAYAKEGSYHGLTHLPVARAIAAQLILGIQFIHSQGIVHGDLYLQNILIRLPIGMRGSCKQLLTRMMKVPVIRNDGAPLDPGVPSEVVIPAWLGLDSDELTLANCPIAIIDFGEAYDPSVTKRASAHTPISLAPPEARFFDSKNNEYLSFPSDIWSLACVIWELFGSNSLFQTFAGTWEEVTVEHVEIFGKLPDRWWNKWSTRSDWFDDDGTKDVAEKYRHWHYGIYENWKKRFPEYIRRDQDRPTLNFGLWSAEEQEAFEK